jgi:hypothetical protein
MKINYTKFNKDYTGLFVAMPMPFDKRYYVGPNPPLYIGLVEADNVDSVRIGITMIYCDNRLGLFTGQATCHKSAVAEMSSGHYNVLRQCALLRKRVQIELS